MFFTIYGHGGHLEFPILTFLSIFRKIIMSMLTMKCHLNWPSNFIGTVI